MTTRRDLLLGLAGLSATSLLPRFAMAGDLVRVSGRAFGTVWHVTLPRVKDSAGLADGIAAILDAVDREMSPFRPASELGRLNAAADTRWHDVSAAFCTVAHAAQAMQEASGGAFDPRVGPAVHRYGFGPIEGTDAVGGAGFEIGESRIRKTDAHLTLDLCGIAKGHAVDRVAAHLTERVHADFLIDIGGEFAARGIRPDGAGWRVGIENPLTGGIRRAVAPGDMALATSGDRVNAFEVGDRRYSHTIDPATAKPVETEVASVSVLAHDAMTADALATALLVLGPERGMALATRLGAGALFLLRAGDGLAEIDNAAFRAVSVEV